MTAWRWTALLGVIAMAFTIAFGMIPGLNVCGAPPGGGGPILAFELVRTPAGVAALFPAGAAGATCVAAQRTGLLVDGLGFIPAYAAFLVLALLAARGRFRRVAPLGIAMVLVAALSDEIEGTRLWAILDSLPGTQANIDVLIVAVRLKFVLLALATALIGGLLTTTRRPLAIVFGAVIVFFGLGALHGLMIDPMHRMMTGFGIAWPVLLLAAIVGSIRPALLDRR